MIEKCNSEYIDFKLIKWTLILSYSDSSSKQKTAGSFSHGPPHEAATEIADCSDDVFTSTPMVTVTSANDDIPFIDE